LYDWVDRHIERRSVTDTFVAGIFATCTAMNVFATIVAVGGNHTFHNFYKWFRPWLVPIVVPVVVVYNILVVYLYKSAKARMAGLAQEQADRRRSLAWTLLWTYFVLTIVSLVAAMLARYDWSK
jgi:hypothetical protein